MAAFAVVGQIADLVATYIGIGFVGPGAEGNPIVVWAIKMFGIIGGLVAVKAAATLIILLSNRRCRMVFGVVGIICALTWVPVFLGLVPGGGE